MSVDTCFKIQAGRIERLHIPAEGLVLPDLAFGGKALTAVRGEDDADWEAWSLPKILRIATCLTPWATWYCAPSFENPWDADESWSGQSWTHKDVVLIRSSLESRASVSCAYHEAMHAAEQFFTWDERRALDVAVARDAEWPDKAYYDTAIERRARLFQWWCMAQFHGGHALVSKHAPETVVMSRVLTGEIGLRVARRGWIPADRMADGLRQRLEGLGSAKRAFAAIGYMLSDIVGWIAGAVTQTNSAKTMHASRLDSVPATLAQLQMAEDAIAALPETAFAAKVGEALERLTAGWKVTAQALVAEAKD